MASNSSNNSTTPTISVTETTTANPSLISINPVAQLLLKLNGSNYPTWHAQFQTLLFGYDLIGYIDGTTPCPPEKITVEGTSKTNPNYLHWLHQDSFLRHAILAFVEASIAPAVTMATMASVAWDKLATTYANTSKTRIYGLRNNLVKTTKDNQSVADYMRQIKTIADELALAGSPLSDYELVITVLFDLGDDYKEISTAIRARDSAISFEDLVDKLTDHETFLHREEAHREPSVITTQFTQKGGNSKPKGSFSNNKKNSGSNSHSNNFSNGRTQSASFNSNQGQRPNNSNWRSNNQPKVQCQFCDKYGHVAKNYRSQPPFYFEPQAHFMTHGPLAMANNWVMDSGASHHITSDLQNLFVHSEYGGPEGIVIGDGSDNEGNTRPRPE